MTISHNGFPSCLHIFGHVTRCFPAMHSEMLGVPLMHLQYINNLAYLGDFTYNFWICFCRSPNFFCIMQPIIFSRKKKSEVRSIFDDIKLFYLETLLRNTYIKSYVLVLVCVTRKRWLFLGMMIFAKSPFFWRVGLRKSFVTLLNNFKSKPPLYSHSKQNQFKKWPSNINLKYLYTY